MVDGSFFCTTLTSAEEAIAHLCKKEREHLTPVRRRLSPTQAVVGRVIQGERELVSGMLVRSLALLSNHSEFDR